MLLFPAASLLLVLTMATQATAAANSKPAPRPQLHKAAPSKHLLSARITPGVESGTMTLVGGRAPFKVDLITDSGPLTVYSGIRRTFSVPLLAGSNDYVVTASGESTSSEGLGTARFWVADSLRRRVQRWDAEVDTVTVSISLPGDSVPANVAMRNIAVRPADDNVFVVFADAVDGVTRNRLVRLDASGSVLATIPVPGSYKIQDVTFDATGNIYVCDRGFGSYGDNRVTITKLSPTGTFLMSTGTTLTPLLNPAGQLVYPMANLYTMLEYNAGTNRIIARINTATFAVINPVTLQIESRRYGGDSAYGCMTLNTNTATDVVLYTGGSGLSRTPFFGKQTGFLSDPKYLDPSRYFNPDHSWIVTPTLPAITDIAVDANDFVYTIQHDGTATTTQAYVVTPDGLPAKTIDLPGGTRIAVVR